ncbi:MAG: cobalamin-binding protein [Myxococcota bacterium]
MSSSSPRVVSLLPSATEIVCALGGREWLVGVSHECDYPAGVGELPSLTRPRVELGSTSIAIDRAVREIARTALSIYEIDLERLRAVRPDIIVTQDLCDVCAVSFDEVCAAVRDVLGGSATVIRLQPARLGEILDDIERVGQSLGRDATAVIAGLEARIAAVERRASGAERPSVATVEWTEPVMLGGLWTAELVHRAGGISLGPTTGEKSVAIERAQLEVMAPEVVLIKPCGYDLERAQQELEVLRRTLPWDDWPAVRHGRVYVTDGNAYFNRPGPRIVDSLEILAACVHPERFAEEARRYDAVLRRIS